MSSSSTESAREVLIEGLGRLSAEEERQLHGPDWARFADRKVQSLQSSRAWVVALGITMVLFAVAAPTTGFYHYYDAADSFSVLGFLGLIAGACSFSAAQMAAAVYVYMNWRHQLHVYEGLRALGEDAEPAPETERSA